MAMAAKARTAENRELGYIQDCLGAYLFQRPLPEPPGELDWEKLQRILIEEQLAGLFSILARANPAQMPKGLRDRLREGRFQQLLYTDRCAEQARAVLAAIDGRGVPVMVLKGWALVQLVYGGDYSQRPAVDIDLLVKPEDAGQAIEALQALGYAATEMEPWPGYFQRFLNGSHYTRAEGTGERRQVFNVDLHWGFPDAPYYDRRIAVEALFERSLAIEVAGVAVRSLASGRLGGGASPVGPIRGGLGLGGPITRGQARRRRR
mgnify:CR=1 FL=1